MAMVGRLSPQMEDAVRVIDMWVEDEQGKRIEIRNFSYREHRESAPMYSIGSVDPRSFTRGRPGVVGNFTTSINDYHDFTEMGSFEVHAQTEGYKIVLSNATLLDYTFTNELEDVKVSFIADRTVTEKLAPKLEKLSNKELAKFVLTSEY